MSRLTRRSAFGLAGIVVLVLVLAFVVFGGGGGGPNYRPLPTLACLRANGFTVG